LVNINTYIKMHGAKIKINNFVIYSDIIRKNIIRRLLLPYTYSHFLTGEKRGRDFPKRENQRRILTTLELSRYIGPDIFTDIN
jgi:hypothetical protein